MRHTVLLLASLPLLTTACGPGKSSDDGSDGPMEPFDCSDVEGELVPHGEEVESADGCTTMVCSDGVLSIAEDRRATIAGDLELSTQAEVDAQVCLGTVEGALRITGAVTDLMPLMPLSRVGQGVEITATELDTMDGLQGLLEVGGAITVADNASLTRLGFGPRMSAFGDVVIQNNDALTTLAGAEFLGQCVACSTVARGPRALVADEEPAAADEGTGGAEPMGDGGLDQPAGGTFYGNILIADNDVLTDIWAMSNLYYAWANVAFRNNAALTTLDPLQMMEVRGDLEIVDHATMPTASAQAFADRVVVQGVLTICGNLDGEPCP